MKVRSLFELLVHSLCMAIGVAVVVWAAAWFGVDAFKFDTFKNPLPLFLFPIGFTLGGTLSMVVARWMSRWIAPATKEETGGPPEKQEEQN